MQFSLDMIWFDENGSIVHIEEDISPCKTATEIMACQSIVPRHYQTIYATKHS